MNLPFLRNRLDERFFEHRRRSTSLAGVIGGTVSLLLFAWRLYVDHVWNWDLAAVGTTFVVVKLSLMTWYHLTD